MYMVVRVLLLGTLTIKELDILEVMGGESDHAEKIQHIWCASVFWSVLPRSRRRSSTWSGCCGKEEVFASAL